MQGQTPIRSDDGRWEWDGQAWQPTAAPPPAPPVAPAAEPRVPIGTWAPPAAPAPDLPTYTGYMDHPAPETRGGGAAIASLILGILALVAWLFPIAGALVGAPGLIFGLAGRGGTRRGMAVAGIVMSSIGLALSVGNFILGVAQRLGSG